MQIQLPTDLARNKEINSTMKTVEETFAAHRAQISELREQDATFGQICIDYDCLSQLVSGHHAEPHLKNIFSSLAALEEEIRGYLEAQTHSGREPK